MDSKGLRQFQSLVNSLFLLLKEKAKSSSHSLHLSLTFIGLVVSFARSENEESTKQKMKRIVWQFLALKFILKSYCFFLYY